MMTDDYQSKEVCEQKHIRVDEKDDQLSDKIDELSEDMRGGFAALKEEIAQETQRVEKKVDRMQGHVLLISDGLTRLHEHNRTLDEERKRAAERKEKDDAKALAAQEVKSKARARLVKILVRAGLPAGLGGVLALLDQILGLGLLG